MATVTTIPNYIRQQSTDSGWDNPFRPGGDLSREADEIVNMIRGGKPITPTEDNYFRTSEDSCKRVVATNVNKINATPNQPVKNGANASNVQEGMKKGKVQPQQQHQQEGMMANPSISTENKGASSSQVSKKVVPGPASASHIIIDEKKKTSKGCCSVQ